MKLTSKQRAHLKALAHPLKPLLQVGKEGIGKTLIGAIDEAFNTRELIKIKVLDSAPESAQETAQRLASPPKRIALVQVIGRTIVLYRRHPENPDIVLPQ